MLNVVSRMAAQEEMHLLQSGVVDLVSSTGVGMASAAGFFVVSLKSCVLLGNIRSNSLPCPGDHRACSFLCRFV